MKNYTNYKRMINSETFTANDVSLTGFKRMAKAIKNYACNGAYKRVRTSSAWYVKGPEMTLGNGGRIECEMIQSYSTPYGLLFKGLTGHVEILDFGENADSDYAGSVTSGRHMRMVADDADKGGYCVTVRKLHAVSTRCYNVEFNVRDFEPVRWGKAEYRHLLGNDFRDVLKGTMSEEYMMMWAAESKRGGK